MEIPRVGVQKVKVFKGQCEVSEVVRSVQSSTAVPIPASPSLKKKNFHSSGVSVFWKTLPSSCTAFLPGLRGQQAIAEMREDWERVWLFSVCF